MVNISLRVDDIIIIVRLLNNKINELEIKIIEERNETSTEKIRSEILTIKKIVRRIKRGYILKSALILSDLFNNTEEINLN